MQDRYCLDCGEYGHRTCDPTVTTDIAADDAYRAYVAEIESRRVSLADPKLTAATVYAAKAMGTDTWVILTGSAWGLPGHLAFVRDRGTALFVGTFGYFNDAFAAIRDVDPAAGAPEGCYLTAPHAKGDCVAYLR